MAAIENQGLTEERDVQVIARLIDPTAAGAPELLYETVEIDALEAGEMRIVRFTQVSALPTKLDRYQLVVEVQPVPGETERSDNRLVYDVLLHKDN